MNAAELQAFIASGRHQVAFTDAAIRAHQRVSSRVAEHASVLARYAGAHQAQVDAARRTAALGMSKLRGADAEARAARGLVSESTSGFALRRTLPTAIAWAESCISIDRHQARVTRMRKAVGVGAKCLLNLQGGDSGNNVMVTLTYRGTNDDWRPRHVSDYIRKVREWFKERCPGERLRYVWVAELQDGKRREDGQGRNVIHYHAIFFLPAGVSMPQADRKGWWPHGFTNTEKGRAPVAYLMSYAKKANSKNIGGFPRGARISAVGGLDSVSAAIKRWALWPAYVQGNASINDRFKPAAGGGYLNDRTGELLLAEFAPTGGGFQSFIRVRTTPRRIEAAGPFSWLPDTGGAAAPAYLH